MSVIGTSLGIIIRTILNTKVYTFFSIIDDMELVEHFASRFFWLESRMGFAGHDFPHRTSIILAKFPPTEA